MLPREGWQRRCALVGDARRITPEPPIFRRRHRDAENLQPLAGIKVNWFCLLFISLRLAAQQSAGAGKTEVRDG